MNASNVRQASSRLAAGGRTLGVSCALALGFLGAPTTAMAQQAPKLPNSGITQQQHDADADKSEAASQDPKKPAAAKQAPAKKPTNTAPAETPPSAAAAETPPPANSAVGIDAAAEAGTTDGATETTAEGTAAATESDADEKQGDPKQKPKVADSKPRPPPPPLRTRVHLEAFIDTVWHTDEGYRLFSDNAAGVKPGVLIGYDVLDLSESTKLNIGLGYRGESASDGVRSYEAFDGTSLTAHHALAAAQLSHALTGWFRAHARLQAGVTHTELWVSPDYRHDAAEKTRWLPFAGLGGGFSIATLGKRLNSTRKSFNTMVFGFGSEGGYLVSAPFELAYADDEADPPDQNLATRGASLGKLGRSGAYFQLNLFMEF